MTMPSARAHADTAYGKQHDPAPDVRRSAIERMRKMNTLHARHAWEKRRSDPLAAYGIAFLFVQPDTRPGRSRLYHLTAATKLWLEGPESTDLARLLYELNGKVAEQAGQPGWDVRDLTNRRDDHMAVDAVYAGVAVSSLDTYTGTWAHAQAVARSDSDIPGSIRIILTDSTIIVCERRSLAEYGEFQIHSTHSLEISPGHSPYPWNRSTAEDLREGKRPYKWSHATDRELRDLEERDTHILRFMSALHETVWAADAARLDSYRHSPPRREDGSRRRG
ncbi:hypothetical protein [Catellatospora sp. NPDC049609]|uniref:hypothetical protein n=1 Tax=Catellatospora sp. NPDC049609 TaxID=3155505 RepID=UPI003417D069